MEEETHEVEMEEEEEEEVERSEFQEVEEQEQEEEEEGEEEKKEKEEEEKEEEEKIQVEPLSNPNPLPHSAHIVTTAFCRRGTHGTGAVTHRRCRCAIRRDGPHRLRPRSLRPRRASLALAALRHCPSTELHSLIASRIQPQWQTTAPPGSHRCPPQ